MDETLVLSDASQEDAVLDVLAHLDLVGVQTRVEIALDYPGQQLAVDLWAETQPVLVEAVQTIQAALKQRLGTDVPTASALERAASAPQTA